MVAAQSPLRYPGGKGQLSPYLKRVIAANQLEGCDYFEPYCGGAGAALKLLDSNVVGRVFLNDADRRVYSFWRAILSETDRFVDKIGAIDLTVEEWKKQREICHDKRAKLFDIGFATFYMNRCNRSGVLTGAGPIGGYRQTGNWKIDARFNRKELARRIVNLGRLRGNISISCLDAIDFLKQRIPKGRDRESTFVYLDPPYVQKGQRLYLNAYVDKDHRSLARYLQRQTRLSWIVSYDDCRLVRDIYSDMKIRRLKVKYSLQRRRNGDEVVISPKRVCLPYSSECVGN